MLTTFLNILATIAFFLGCYLAAMAYLASRDRRDLAASVMSSALSILFGSIALCGGAWLLAGFVSHV